MLIQFDSSFTERGFAMRATILLSLASFLSTGCATIMTGGGHNQNVRFNSQPRGAQVYVDDNYIGKTPISAELTRRDDHKVRMVLEGYQPEETVLKHGPNLWTFGNVIFGGLIGVAVDAISGSWEGVLNPNDYDRKLTRLGPDAPDSYGTATYAPRAYNPPPRQQTAPPARAYDDPPQQFHAPSPWEFDRQIQQAGH